MVNRSDISKRSKRKALQRLNAKKAADPDKYTHETAEYSIYLGLEWDYKHKQINPGKIPYLEELRVKYGEKK